MFSYWGYLLPIRVLKCKKLYFYDIRIQVQFFEFVWVLSSEVTRITHKPHKLTYYIKTGHI